MNSLLYTSSSLAKKLHLMSKLLNKFRNRDYLENQNLRSLTFVHCLIFYANKYSVHKSNMHQKIVSFLEQFQLNEKKVLNSM